MKAITIHQPWASLIAIGAKRFETRGWKTNYRGPIAIHAGKKIHKEAFEQFHLTLWSYGIFLPTDLPTGAVVATANLQECFKVLRDVLGGVVNLESETRRTHFNTLDKEYELGWYDDGRFAWQMSDVRRPPEPIPAKGQQGLWNWRGTT